MLGWLGMCWDLLNAALAMHALKQSLSIPERMGWNGDPCAPTVWDAWQGVTCNLAADGSSLIITQMYVWVFSTTSNLTTLSLSLVVDFAWISCLDNNQKGASPL